MNMTGVEAVRKMFLLLRRRCKEQKQKVIAAEKEYEEAKKTYCFEDEQCLVESAKEKVLIEKAKLEELVSIKISTEKYMRKLKWDELKNEKNNK